jgi:tetratricopeptide (TPR) repeat protein
LLADVSVARRQRLHLRVADEMEALLGSTVEERAAEIAYHLQEAGTAAAPDRTVRYLECAARNALNAVAPEDAERHVDTALELVGTSEPHHRATLLGIRAQARRAIGRIEEALTDLAAALELAPTGPDHDLILGQRARLHVDLFEGAAASADLMTVLASARARSDAVTELDTLLALGRAYYVQALDDPSHAEMSRATYEEAYALAESLGDRPSMAQALVPTAWFTDFWTDYGATAEANVETAARIADELGDETLAIEAATAGLRFSLGPEVTERSERLRARLEARHDPVRLKEHYFWLMWHYLWLGQLERSIETCDLGIELARQLGSPPVQYGSIKALALTELGRFDMVETALAQEVTDDAHPFGQANEAYARALYLNALEAWLPAVDAALDAMQRGASLSRVWIQRDMLSLAITLEAKAGDDVRTTTSEIEAIVRAADVRPSLLAQAERRLAAGDPLGAIDRLLEAIAVLEASYVDRDLGWNFECAARAYTELEEYDAALAAIDRAFTLPTTAARLPLTWRLHRCRGNLFERLGRTGDARIETGLSEDQFRSLAARIPNPDLQRWFEAQPLAPRGTENRGHL